MREIAFDLVPPLMQGKAPRNFMRKSEWAKIRALVMARAAYACEFCGSPLKLEAHEIYAFRGDLMILEDIACACKKCHFAIHAGRALAMGKLKNAVSRLASVRRISVDEAWRIWSEAWTRWLFRKDVSRLDWSLLASAPWRDALSGESLLRAIASSDGADCALQPYRFGNEPRNDIQPS